MLKLEALSSVESYSQFYGKLIEWELPNGVIYRKFGPAIIWEDGSEEWFQNGQNHREDIPAIMGDDKADQYWINRRNITK